MHGQSELFDARRELLRKAVEEGWSLKEIGEKIHTEPLTRERARQLLHQYHLHTAWATRRRKQANTRKADRQEAYRKTLKRVQTTEYVADVFRKAGFTVECDPWLTNRLFVNHVPVEVHVCRRVGQAGYYRINSSHPRAARAGVLPSGEVYVLPPRFDRENGVPHMAYIPATALGGGHHLHAAEEWFQWYRR